MNQIQFYIDNFLISCCSFMVTDLAYRQRFALHLNVDVFYAANSRPALTSSILQHVQIPKQLCTQETDFLNPGIQSLNNLHTHSSFNQYFNVHSCL